MYFKKFGKSLVFNVPCFYSYFGENGELKHDLSTLCIDPAHVEVLYRINPEVVNQGAEVLGMPKIESDDMGKTRIHTFYKVNINSPLEPESIKAILAEFGYTVEIIEQ